MSHRNHNVPFRPRQHLGSLFDAALVQIGWWVCVLGAVHDSPWLGPAAVAVLLTVQVGSLVADARRQALQHVLLLGLCGTALDSLLSGFGLMSLKGSFSPWLAPLWITALWCQFATVVPALTPLRSRPFVVALIGGLGGPLAYGGGARMGAASLHPEPWISLVALGLVWAVALNLMLSFLIRDNNDEQHPGTPSLTRATRVPTS